MTKISFSENGRVYVPIYIKPHSSLTMQAIPFKVDTGADFTTVSKASLLDLGFDAMWINQNAKKSGGATTATGEYVETGFVQIPMLNLLGYEAINWPFAILLDKDKDFRDLLGRDLLTGFNYTFNNDDDIFQIAMAREFKPRFDFLPGQEIHLVHKQ